MATLFDSIELVSVTAFPLNPNAGRIIFRSDLNKFFIYSGTAWESFTPASDSGESTTITMGSGEQVLAEGGTSPPGDGAPSYAFSSDLDTGLWNPSDGVVRIASDGAGVAEFEHTEGMTLLTGQFQAPDGSDGAPSYANEGDEDTGMYFPADNSVGFAVGGNLAMTIGSNGVLNLATAGYETLMVSANDIPNKAYVDNLSAGLDPKESCRVGTTGTLTSTAGNGTWVALGSGVGKTLTAGASGTTTLDTVLLADGDRVLVKDEAGGIDNGIYVASATAVGANTILTRATDQDGSPTSEVSGGNFTFIEAGSQAGSLWAVAADGLVSVDSVAMNWVQIGGGIAGFPLLAPVSATPQFSFSGNTSSGLSLNASTLTLNINGDQEDVVISAGDATTLNADGGNITLTTGALDGAGAHGDVIVTRGQMLGPIGSNSSPTYSFSGFANVGTYYDSGSIAFAVGGAKIAEFTSTSLDGNALYLRGRGGTAANPGVSFSVDDDTGMYRSTADEIGFATNGEQRVNISDTGMNLKADTGVEYELRFEDGTNGTYVGFKAPDDVTTQTVWSLPVDDGSLNQALVTSGGAVLSWATMDLVTELIASTTDATETELAGPGSTYYDIASGESHAVEILVIGEKTDGSVVGMWKVLVCIKNVAGTTSIVGTDTTTEVTNIGGWSIAVSADNANNRLAVKVTGGASDAISWKAKITSTKV